MLKIVSTRLDPPAYKTRHGQPVWQDKLQQFCWQFFFLLCQKCEDFFRHFIIQQSLQDKVQPGTVWRLGRLKSSVENVLYYQQRNS
jgi:hypothetical protein